MKEGCTAPETGAFLHAFELGLLGETECADFETHLLSCRFCFDQVRDFEAESTMLRESVSELLPVLSAKSSEKKSIWRQLWPDAPLVFRPAAAYALVGLLLLSMVAGYRQEAGDVRTVQSVVLTPMRNSQSAILKSSTDQDALISFLYRGGSSDKSVIVKIEDESGSSIYTDEEFSGFDEHETGRLLIPHQLLTAGVLRLIIYEPGDSDDSSRQEYVLTIE